MHFRRGLRRSFIRSVTCYWCCFHKFTSAASTCKVTLRCCSSCFVEKAGILFRCFETSDTEDGKTLDVIGHSEDDNSPLLFPSPRFEKRASLLITAFLASLRASSESIFHYFYTLTIKLDCSNHSYASYSIPNKMPVSILLPPLLTDKQTA